MPILAAARWWLAAKVAKHCKPILRNALGTAGAGGDLTAGEDVYSEIKVLQPLQTVAWAAPPAWQQGETAGVRFSSFTTLLGSEVSLVSFPGDVGGLNANVQRWLGQMKVQPPPQSLVSFLLELAEVRSKTGLPYIYLNLTPFATTNTILVASIALPMKTLFVKLSCNADIAAEEEVLFLEFLQSFRVD